MPEIIPRDEWLSFEPRHQAHTTHKDRPVVVHWFGPGRPAETLRGGISQCQGFASWHYQLPPNGLGWADYAYNWTILREGTVLEGRGRDVRGAHAGSNLGNSLAGVMILVGTDEPEPTPAQYESLQWLAARERWTKYMGHYEFSPTSCPGPVLRPWILENRIPNAPASPWPRYGYEDLPFNMGGIGPGPTDEDFRFLYRWRRKAWRDLRYDAIVERHPGFHPQRVRFEDGAYGIVFYPPGRYGARPRWIGFEDKEKRDNAMDLMSGRLGRPLRPFRVTENFNGSYMAPLP